MIRKTLLLIGFVAMFGITNVLGQTTEAIDISAQGFGNTEDLGTITQGDVTLTFDSGGGQNPPKYYTTGAAARFYAKNTLAVEAGGQTITNVVFTLSSGGDAPSSSNPSYDSGTLTIDNNTRMTWTGSSDEVMIANTATKGHFRIQSVEVTFDGNANGVTLPKVTGPADMFTGTRNVTITSDTPDATIFYTTDGINPTTATVTSGPSPLTFPITGTTIVKAMVSDGAMRSGIVSKTFRAAQETISSLNALSSDNSVSVTTSDVVLTLNNAQVIFNDGTNVYLREGGKAVFLPYGLANWAVNTIMTGILPGHFTNNYGIPEMGIVNLGDLVKVPPTSTELDPTPTTLAEINDLRHKADLILLSGVTITTDGANYFAVSGSDKVRLYSVNEDKTDKTAAILAGFDTTGSTPYDVIGVFYKINNAAPEVDPVEISLHTADGIDGVNIGCSDGKDTPVYNLAGQRVNPSTKGIVIKNGKKLIVK